MKRFFRIIAAGFTLITASSLAALPGTTEVSPKLDLHGDAVPGGVVELSLAVPGAPLMAVSVEVQDEAGVPIHAFKGFRRPRSGGETLEDSWIVLIGIPPDQRPGEYLLKVTAKVGSESLSFIRPVLIEERTFQAEDIRLNKTMSELRKEGGPRKEEEARALYELLVRFNPDTIFQTGPFIHPVGTYPQSAGFGDRRTYFYSDGGKSKAFHGGVDFATPRGTPVSACGSGRIVLTKSLLITGNTVVIEHLPGVYSLYFHLDSVDAKVGRDVKAGERIGLSGMTGLATGPHLHWELRVAGIAVDPLPFLKRALLPESP